MSHAFRALPLVVAFLAGVSGPALAQTPVELIQQAYRHLDTVGMPPDQAYFTPDFHKVVQQERRCEEKLDDQRYAGMIWFGGQDWAIDGLQVSEEDVGATTRRAVARFKNMDEAQTRVFVLERTGSGWRIDNVIADGLDLRRAMQEDC